MAPGVLADILAAAPEVKILATSRRRLLLQAEWIFEVTGLPVPENGSHLRSGGHHMVPWSCFCRVRGVFNQASTLRLKSFRAISPRVSIW